MLDQILNGLYTLCSSGQPRTAYWLLEEYHADGTLCTEEYVEYKQALREDFPEFREYAQEQ